MFEKSNYEFDSPNKNRLKKWLNKSMKVEITDGRILIGTFLCTDKNSNLVLGLCKEYTLDQEEKTNDPRSIGLSMIPGNHVISISVDESIV